MSGRYLVTGAQGFVGRYMVAQLLGSQSTEAVLGIGRSRESKDTFTHSINWGMKSVKAPVEESILQVLKDVRYQYRSADIGEDSQMTKLLESFAPNVIIHLASGLRDDDFDFLYETNVRGLARFMTSIERADILLDRLILGSTGGVYGAADESSLPFSESSATNPVDVYSTSKLAGEHISRVVGRKIGISPIWVRLFNLVGPGQDERHVCGRFCSWIATILKREMPPILEVGPLDTTRDFIDVRDVVRAIDYIIQNGSNGKIYNVASGIETRVQSVLDTVLSIAALHDSVKIEQLPGRLAEIPRHVANIEPLLTTGYSAEYTLEQSLRDLLDYYMITVFDKTHTG